METLLILLPIIVIFVVFVYAAYRVVKYALSPYKEEAEKARKSYEAGYFPREINPVPSSRHQSSPSAYVPTSVSDVGVYSPPPLTAQDHQMLAFAEAPAPYIQEVPSVQAPTEDSASGGMDFGWSSTPASSYEPPSCSYSSSYDSGNSSDFGSSSSSYDSGSSSCSSDFGS